MSTPPRAWIALLMLAALLAGGCAGTAPTATRHPHRFSGLPAAGGPLPPAGSGWTTLLNSPSHFGAAAVGGPLRASIRWQRRLEGAIVPGPVIRGGVGFVASNAGVLHALDIATGRDRWTFNGGGSFGSDLSTAPTLADGLILWPGPRARLFALTSRGELRWTLPTAAEPLTPAVDASRRLLVLANTEGGLSAYRLSSDGSAPRRLWTLILAAPSFGNPALASDGTTYETAGESLYAVAADGRLRWQVRTRAQVEVSAAVGEDGVIVFGSNDSTEYGVGPDGRVRWRHPIGNYTYSSPLTLRGHRVAFGNHGGELSVLDTRDGHLISRDLARGQIWTSAAVDTHGDAYFASRTGGIYGFGSDGRRLFTLQTATTFASYPAIAADGTLLVGGDDGVLRAIR